MSSGVKRDRSRSPNNRGGGFRKERYKVVQNSKVGRVPPLVVVSLLPHAEVGTNDHRDYAPHFN